jgi:hypothetical protein
MRPYLITAKLMRPSNMKRFPTPVVDSSKGSDNRLLNYVPLFLNVACLMHITRRNQCDTFSFWYRPHHILTVIKRFDKHFICNLQGG